MSAAPGPPALPPMLASGALLALGGLWMALAPQLPPLRARRAALAAFTWLATRGGLAVLTWRWCRSTGLEPGRFFAGGYSPSAGAPWRPESLAAPFFAAAPLAVLLLADLGVWRLLAGSGDDAAELEWSWVASPAVWFPLAFALPTGAAGALLLLFGWRLARDGRAFAAGLALGLAPACSTPIALLPALAIALTTPGRTRATFALALPVALALAARLAARHGAIPPGLLGSAGPTPWRLASAFGLAAPRLAAWLPMLAAVAVALAFATRHRLSGPAAVALAFAAFAMLAPRLAPMDAVVWAPLLILWSAGDPDARGWWLVYGTALPIASLLALRPLAGAAGISWRLVAAVTVAGVAVLGAWPLAHVLGGVASTLRKAAAPPRSP